MDRYHLLVFFLLRKKDKVLEWLSHILDAPFQARTEKCWQRRARVLPVPVLLLTQQYATCPSSWAQILLSDQGTALPPLLYPVSCAGGFVLSLVSHSCAGCQSKAHASHYRLLILCILGS